MFFCADAKLLLSLAACWSDWGAAQPCEEVKLIALKIMCQVWSSVLQLGRGQVTLSGLPVVTQSTVCLIDVEALVHGDVPVPALAESLEKSRRFRPSPTCVMLWKAAWQSACTHARLNTAAGARMRRNHELPGQFRPVTLLILPSGHPGVQSHGLKSGTGRASKRNSSLKYTHLVMHLYEG